MSVRSNTVRRRVLAAPFGALAAGILLVGLAPGAPAAAVPDAPDPAPAAAPADVTSLIVAYAPGVAPVEPSGVAAGSSDVTTADLQAGEAIGFGLRTVDIAAPVSVETAEALATELEASPDVLWAQPDYPVDLATVQPSAPWGLDRIDQRGLPLDTEYIYDTTGAGVNAYVIDTGIRRTHVQFAGAGRVAAGHDAVLDGNGTDDCNGHGTHVAGTIGGSTYGVAKSVTLVPVRVFGCTGTTATSTIVDAITWVLADHDAGEPAVANMSLGGTANTALDNAVAAMITDGITVVVASGNGVLTSGTYIGADACSFSPARVAGAITVNASSITDTRPVWSNYGACTDLYAPGVSIQSSYYLSDTSTEVLSGTSMATPHVAGTVAGLLSATPTLTPAQVWSAIDAATTQTVNFGVGGSDPNKLLYDAPGVAAVAPSAPQTVAATAGAVSAAVTWAAPTSNGGSAITGYVARAFDAATNGTLVSSCPPTLTLACTVTGLANGTTYFVDVVATNAVGTSLPSSPRVAVTPVATPTPPSAPQTVVPTAGNTSIAVTWAAPAQPGTSAVSGYTARAWTTLSGGTAVTSCQPSPATNTTCTLTGLANATTYYVDVTASNDSGPGPANSPRIAATPTAPPTVPTAPLSVTRTAGDTVVAVTWAAPSSNGGSAITGYVARAWSTAVGGSILASCPSTPTLACTVTGLANGTAYYVDVVATNALGTGSPSPRAAVTPTAPVVPVVPVAPVVPVTPPPADSGSSGGGSSAAEPVTVVTPTAAVTSPVPVAPVAPTAPAPTTPPAAAPSSIGPVLYGVTRPTPAQLATARPLTVADPVTRTAAKAPAATARVGRTVRLSVEGLRPSARVGVQIRLGGTYYSLGRARVDSDGAALLPAFRVSKPGTYVVRITDTRGTARYAKVVVGGR